MVKIEEKPDTCLEKQVPALFYWTNTCSLTLSYIRIFESMNVDLETTIIPSYHHASCVKVEYQDIQL